MGAAERTTRAPGSRREAPERPEPKRRVNSAELFAGGREVIIEHNGEEYRLRITRQWKLILTK